MIKVLQYYIVVLSVNQVPLFLSSSNEALTYIPKKQKDEGGGGGGGEGVYCMHLVTNLVERQ